MHPENRISRPDGEITPADLEFQYAFDNSDLFRAVCGVADRGIGKLESLLDVRIIPRGNAFLVKAPDHARADFARQFLRKITARFGGDPNYLQEIFDEENLFRNLKNELLTNHDENGRTEGDDQSGADPLKEKVFTTYRGKSIYPRTPNQARYVDSVLNHSVTFGLGPAGTGKTFLAIAAACRKLQTSEVERIILTRPAVEAGESLGYLPGDLNQKVDPYLRPVYDALYECLGLEKVHELIQSRKIEIAPLAYMRGRTLSRSFIVLDEAQNCTLSQLKMFLTRLGKQSHMCLSGDVTQIDLGPGKSGVVKATRLLKGVESIGIIEFRKKDIIRNPLVERIVEAFEKAQDD